MIDLLQSVRSTELWSNLIDDTKVLEELLLIIQGRISGSRLWWIIMSVFPLEDKNVISLHNRFQLLSRITRWVHWQMLTGLLSPVKYLLIDTSSEVGEWLLLNEMWLLQRCWRTFKCFEIWGHVNWYVVSERFAASFRVWVVQEEGR